MPVHPMDWIESVDAVEVEKIGDEEYVILCVEEDDPLKIRHRITWHNFRRIFGPAFREVDSIDEITPEHFRRVLDQNPDADYELLRKDLGYRDVIDHWEQEGAFSHRNSGGSSF